MEKVPYPHQTRTTSADEGVLSPQEAASRAAEARAATAVGSSSSTTDAAAERASTPGADKQDEADTVGSPSALDKGKGRATEEDEQAKADEVSPVEELSTPARKVIRTVDDLEDKSCWICMDDDLPYTRFVHPCNCTLIAHELCLLTWISSQQQTKGDRDPVRCPQCKAEFLVNENLSSVLKALNKGDRLLGKASALLIFSTLGSSILTTSTLVGFSSLRLFFGPDVARTTLTGLSNGQPGIGAWRWWAWIGLPLVPVGLILNSLTTSFLAEARIKVLESLLLLTPFFLLPRPHLQHPSSPRGPWLFTRSLVGELWSVKWGVWPPGPGSVIVLLGVGEVVYLALKREIERFVLGSSSTRRSFFAHLWPFRPHTPALPPAGPVQPERRFLATPNPAGGVRFRVFEPEGAGEGEEVETDEVAIALAEARRQGVQVQVRVWEDERVDGEEGERRRRRGIVEPLNWDQFDAAGDMSDDEEDEEDEEEDVPLAIDTNVSDDDYVGAPNDDKDANDTNSFGEYDGYVFNDDHEEEEDEQDEEQEEDDESDNDDDELAAIELAIAAGPNPPENGPGARGEGDLPLEALFLSRLSLSRIAASALLMPALSALAGRGLLVLAQRWSPSLARFLGVRYAGGGGGRGGLVMGAAFWGGVRGFALGGGGGGGGVDGLDPVWWRNTVGAGLIVLLRDAFSLLHKYLKIQSRRTRKIVERSFEGLEMS